MPIQSSLTYHLDWTTDSADGVITQARDGWPETRHPFSLWQATADLSGTTRFIRKSTSDELPNRGFLRSTAKPFQTLPLLEAFPDIAPEALAVACASHSGTLTHQSWVHSLLKPLGLGAEDCLQCGVHPPLDKTTRTALTLNHETPTAIHHNCSGKHAGFLRTCHKNGWSPDSYLELNHPLQQAIKSHIERLSGETAAAGVDGCNAPAWVLSFEGIARLYLALGSVPELQPIREAMTQHPELVGGPGRVDTELMKASDGQILAKVGADGLLCLTHLNKEESLVLKVWSGSEPARNWAIQAIVSELGWLESSNQKTLLTSAI